MTARTSKKRRGQASKPIARRTKLPDIEELMLDGRLIDRAIELGVRDAIIEHQRAGVPVVVWENGRSVFKSASDVLAELDGKRNRRKRPKQKKRSANVKARKKSSKRTPPRAKRKKDIDRIFAEGKAIDEAARQGVRDALLQHKRAGVKIATIIDGKVVRVPA
jgi:hypothetical protein